MKKKRRAIVSNYLLILMALIRDGQIGLVPDDMYSEEYKEAFKNLQCKILSEAADFLSFGK